MWEERLHKLSDEDRERVIRFHQDDRMTASAIARRFHVSVATVSRILDEEGKLASDIPSGRSENWIAKKRPATST